MRFNLIVAMCRNNGIGYKGKIPWTIEEDLKYFSEITKGDGNNVVIMGNKTWQSLPTKKDKPRGLPSRDNFILSHTDSFDMLINHSHLLKTFKRIGDIESFLTQNEIYEEAWVIGGSQVYKQFLEQGKIQKCYVTFIDEDFECDTFFPLLDSTEWKQIERTENYNKTYKCLVSYVVFEKIDDIIL